MDASAFRTARHGVEEMTPIGEESRKAVTDLLRRLDSRHCGRLATRGQDTKDRRPRGRGEKYRAIGVPRATAAVWSIRHNLRGTAADIDPLEFAVRKEPTISVVRRPERQ